MSKYEVYPSYTDSGIEWLEKIPEYWENYRIDWISTIIRGNTGFKKDELLDNGEYVALQYGKTYKVDEVNETFKFYVNGEFYKFSQVVHLGDTILISTSETIEDLGHSCFYNRDDLGLIGGEQILLKPNSELVFEKYLYYSSKVFCNRLNKYATGLKVFRFNIDDLKNIFISIPPLQEQQTIANYLDIATAKIDTLIKKQTKLIELLNEKRQAIISTAVTRGLDSTVAMKDSGVEWLGEIPEHWNKVSIKLILDIRDGTHDTPAYIDENLNTYPLVTSKDFDGNCISFVKTKYISKKDHALISSRSKVDNGDVLMSMIGGNIGKSLIVNTDREISIKNVALFKTNRNPVLAKLLLFYLESYLLEVQIDLQNRGGAQGFLSLGDIRNLVFPKMPLSEQKEIVSYLDEKTSKIDNLIIKSTEAIDLLKEKRTALISAAVTGKIDVRVES